jgi:hypothetical protein
MKNEEFIENVKPYKNQLVLLSMLIDHTNKIVNSKKYGHLKENSEDIVDLLLKTNMEVSKKAYDTCSK